MATPTREAAVRPPVLAVSGLRVRLGARPVLDGVDLEVGGAEVVALVGENGAGKTTLVRCLAGELRPDAGTIHLPGGRRALGVVWQDLALCDHLDVVANVWLGREPSVLDDAAMEADTRRLLGRLGIELPDLRRPVGTLSGGERQLVAVARAVAERPELCVLDEPTAALGSGESRTVEAIVRDLRAQGVAVLLVSHQPEVVTGLADRVAVLHGGRVAACVAPGEVHPDDLLALMTGAEVDTTARRQLRRLQALVDQLSEAHPSAALPVVVSAAGAALGQERLCVHLLDQPADGPPRLRSVAAVALPPPLAGALAELPVGVAGGPVGIAAATGSPAAAGDLGASDWPEVADAARLGGLASAWSVPLIGRRGVLGVLSGFDTTPGAPSEDHLALVSLYAAQAATAVERASLLEEVTRRNEALETLRAVLERLAGPEGATEGPAVALSVLCRGLPARAAALYRRAPGEPVCVAAHPAAGDGGPDRAALAGAAATLLSGAGGQPHSVDLEEPGGLGMLRAPGTLAVRFAVPGGPAVVAAAFDAEAPDGAVDLLVDATRSFRLALEREALEAARREGEAAQRSARLQREFLSRLSHELRTPLTAICGYASSLRQRDVSFDEATTERFLANIADESNRLSRLVSDLLDATALDSGVLRLHCDWCDLPRVVGAALTAVPGGLGVEVVAPEGLPPVWGDHDRLCQVVVNLVENALRHTPEGTAVRVGLGPGPEGTVELRVTDEGPGLSPESVEELFLPWRQGAGPGREAGRPGAGLGLSIARGIVEAHGGTVSVEAAEAAGEAAGAAAGTTFLVRLPVEPPESSGTWEPVEVDMDG